MKKVLCIAFIFGLLLSGCGSEDKKTSKKSDKVEEKELSADEISKKLFDINYWVVGDFWNDALCDIVWYINSGTSATGGEMDPEITLKKYTKEFKKVEKYNTFINGLDKKDYDDVKFTWGKMYEEMKKLDAYIQKNGVNANADPSFNADVFSQARNAFGEAVNDLIPED